MDLKDSVGIRQAIAANPVERNDVAVKNDIFLPSDESEHSGSDSDPSFRNPEARTCPSCLQRLRLAGKDYHLHLFSCLRSRKDVKESRDKKSAGETMVKLLTNVKSMISKLDLTFRINTMESLRRMAKNTGSPNIMFPHLRKEEVDNKVGFASIPSRAAF